jgi:hypothetical protein
MELFIVEHHRCLKVGVMLLRSIGVSVSRSFGKSEREMRAQYEIGSIQNRRNFLPLASCILHNNRHMWISRWFRSRKSALESQKRIVFHGASF